MYNEHTYLKYWFHVYRYFYKYTYICVFLRMFITLFTGGEGPTVSPDEEDDQTIYT